LRGGCAGRCRSGYPQAGSHAADSSRQTGFRGDL